MSTFAPLLVSLAAIAVAGCRERAVTTPSPPPVVAPSPTPALASAPTFTPGRSTDPIDVAVTVDDLPRHGPDVPGITRLAIHQQMLAAFAKHGVPSVTGFVNAERLEGHPEDIEALRSWVAAGHPLANHTYSHVDAAKLELAPYLADVAAGRPIRCSISCAAEGARPAAHGCGAGCVVRALPHGGARAREGRARRAGT